MSVQTDKSRCLANIEHGAKARRKIKANAVQPTRLRGTIKSEQRNQDGINCYRAAADTHLGRTSCANHNWCQHYRRFGKGGNATTASHTVSSPTKKARADRCTLSLGTGRCWCTHWSTYVQNEGKNIDVVVEPRIGRDCQTLELLRTRL